MGEQNAILCYKRGDLRNVEDQFSQILHTLINNIMDAIKKKMQAMKIEKDNAMDKADMCERSCKVGKLISSHKCHIQTYRRQKQERLRQRKNSQIWPKRLLKLSSS